MKIYNVSGELIFENDSFTMKRTVEAALAAGVSLRGANLRGADLCSANLRGADLRGADLSDTYLRAADLRDTDLHNTILYCAFITDAKILGAILPEGVPVIPNIHQAVYEAASQPGALSMAVWHTCETTHCRAGWAVTLAGEEGRALEDKMGSCSAATLIYAASDPALEHVPDWVCSNEKALEDMRRLAHA